MDRKSRISLLRRGSLTFDDLKGLRSRGYIRESTKDQKDGYSPEVQRNAEARFAETHGMMPPDRFYMDLVSGTSALKRSDFQQAVADARANQYDVLLVFHTSRFARNRRDALLYKDMLLDMGIIVVFVQQGLISLNRRSKLEEGLHELIDEKYSDDLSMWVAAGLKQKFESGKSLGWAPYGYRRDRKGDLKVAPKEAEAVRKMYELYATGRFSYERLAMEINSMVDSKGRPLCRSKFGRPFTKGAVEEILANDTYVGMIRYHPGQVDEEKRSGSHKRIVDRELWDKVQEVKRFRTHSVKRPAAKHRAYPLSGIVVCAHCGSSYSGSAMGWDKTRRLRHGRNVECEHYGRTVPCELLELQFGGFLSMVRLPSNWKVMVTAALRELAAEMNPETAVRMQQRARLEKALENLQMMFKWGDISSEQYVSETRALKAQIASLGVGSGMLGNDLALKANLLNDLGQLWLNPRVHPDTKREMAREIFEEVRVEKGEIVAVRPREAYMPLMASSWEALCRGERI